MATLSQAYRETPLHPRHIIPIDFGSVKAVPESHTWPIFDSYSRADVPHKPDPIPIIDLNGPNVVENLGHACETWGMFQVINHGIPSRLLKVVEFEARRFFSLPLREKMKALRSPRGGTGYGVARITPFFNKFMWHEGFTMMGTPFEHVKKVWPNDYKKFCEVMEEYEKKMKDLAEQLLHLILRSLTIMQNHDQDSETLANWWSRFCGGTTSESTPCTALQLNSYPSCPEPKQVMGLAPHTDTCLLTILHQNDDVMDNGLEVLKKTQHESSGNNTTSDAVGWVPVFPVPGALVVNLGDMLHIVSNGRYPSVLHRATVNQTCHRLSVAYFYGPPMDFHVSPLMISREDDDNKVDCQEAVRFRSITVRDYIAMKAKNLENALSLIRID